MASAEVGSLPMRKLVRSKVTRRFLTESGGWTPQVRDAAEFADFSHALGAVERFELRDVELYYLFSDKGPSGYDFCITLTDSDEV
jgi:hypothetical protein